MPEKSQGLNRSSEEKPEEAPSVPSIGSRRDSAESPTGFTSESDLSTSPSGTPWFAVAGAIGGVAGATAVVYAVGGAVMLMRLNAAGVQANQALGAIPQQTLFAVGAGQLLMPALLAAGLYVFFFLMEQRRDKAKGKPKPPRKKPAPSLQDTETKPRTLGRPWLFLAAIGSGLKRIFRSYPGRVLRRIIRWLLTPLRWYFRYVPDVLLAWLPVLLFLPNPQQTALNAIAATGGAAIPEWARRVSHSGREFALRSALALALLTASVGLAGELLHPTELPKVTIESNNKKDRGSAQFIAVDGGSAYFVEESQLTIIPPSAYQRLVVTGSKTEPLHEESIFERLKP